MLNYSSGPTVTNCTFSGNSATWGGGMYNLGSSPIVSNCILWGNTAYQDDEIYNSSSTPVISYCDITGCGSSGAGWDTALGTDGGGNIDAEPMFADADGRLLPGSPCIDAGDNTAVPGSVTTDFDGNPRFMDDPETADTGNGTPPIVDMGAYEFIAGSGTAYHPADKDSDYVIGDFELLDYIDLWKGGQVDDFELLDTIGLWKAGHYYWDESEQKFKPGEQP